MNFKMFISILPLFGCSVNQQDYVEYQKRTTEIHDQKNIPINTEEINLKGNVRTVQYTTTKRNAHIGNKTKNNVEKKLLNVPLIQQNPELKYGCEVTSLAMVLQYAGVRVTKLQLAKELEKDYDPVRKTLRGDITHWGNPQHGFVGDMTGKNMGYAVFDKPLYELMEKYLPERAVNLTGKPFDQLLTQVKNERPVVVWTTGDYRLPDRWESWKHGNEIIRTPLDLHAVVLVGYDSSHVYLNDPLSGRKAVKVNMHQFINTWNAMKNRAVSYY